MTAELTLLLLLVQHWCMAMLPKVLVVSMELEMVVLVFQKINRFFIGGARKGRKGGQWASSSQQSYFYELGMGLCETIFVFRFH